MIRPSGVVCTPLHNLGQRQVSLIGHTPIAVLQVYAGVALTLRVRLTSGVAEFPLRRSRKFIFQLQLWRIFVTPTPLPWPVEAVSSRTWSPTAPSSAIALKSAVSASSTGGVARTTFNGGKRSNPQRTGLRQGTESTSVRFKGSHQTAVLAVKGKGLPRYFCRLPFKFRPISGEMATKSVRPINGGATCCGVLVSALKALSDGASRKF